MAIKIDVIKDDVITSSQEVTDGAREIVVTNQPAVVTNNTVESVIIEVNKGLPGDQNIYTGPTPPANPQEGWIWIDTSE